MYCHGVTITVPGVLFQKKTIQLHFMTVRKLGRRGMSPSPGLPHCKEEELDEDPSYRQFLSTVRSLLNLPTVDEAAEAPSKIFTSRDRSKRKQAVLSMSLSPVDEIIERWRALENIAEGNPCSEDAEKLRSTQFNSDAFLPYSRPLMKFYITTTSEFSTVAPKCQDSFKGICSRSSSTPSSISIPLKQCMAMEAVKRDMSRSWVLLVCSLKHWINVLPIWRRLYMLFNGVKKGQKSWRNC